MSRPGMTSAITDMIVQQLNLVTQAQQHVLSLDSGGLDWLLQLADREPKTLWQPVQLDACMVPQSPIETTAQCANILSPMTLTVRSGSDLPDRRTPRYTGAICRYPLHVLRWVELKTLFYCLKRLLQAQASILICDYMMRGYQEISPTLLALDRSLRQRSKDLGVRDVTVMTALARIHGFELAQTTTLAPDYYCLHCARHQV